MTTKLKILIEQEYKRVQLIRNLKSLQEQVTREKESYIYPEAENILKGLPGVKKFTRSDGSNRYTIQLRAKTAAKMGGVSDVLTFFPNGTVISGKQSTSTKGYKYEVENGKDIVLYDSAGNKQGVLTDENGEITLGVDENDLEQGGTWVDTVQTVLDWAGLIPVIGDAIDIINAIIYAAREKYFDAALSAIAVIPVAGSVLKLGIKNIGKPVAKFAKGLFKGSAASKLIATKNFWSAVQKAGVITPSTQRTLLRGLGDMGTYVTKTKKTAKQFNFDSPSFMRILDDVEAFFKNSSTALGKSTDAVYKRAGGVAAEFSEKQLADLIRKVPVFRTAAKEINQNPGFFKRAFRMFSLNPLKMRRVKALFNMNPTKLTDIGTYIRKTFDDKLMDPKNADDLLLISKSMNPSTLKNIKFSKNFSYENILKNLKTPAQFEAFAKQLQTVNPIAYKEFASDIIKVAKEQNNFLYFTKLGNSKLKVGGIIDPKQYYNAIVKDKKVAGTIAEMFGDYMKNIQFMGKKQLDIWSNELQELLDELGLSQDNYSDNKDSLFMAVAIEAIKNSVTADQYQNAKEVVANDFMIPVFQAINLYTGGFITLTTRRELSDAIYNIIPGNTKEEKINNVLPKLKNKEQRDAFQEIMDEFN
jgi:hypothetical protein